MNIYATNDFISVSKSLYKKNSYKSIEESLINNIFTNTIDEIFSVGTKHLNKNNGKISFLRKKIEVDGKGKSGGFRLYFWLFKISEDIYLLHVHQKDEQHGNLSKEGRKELIKSFKESKKNKTFTQLYINSDKTKIVYKPKPKTEINIF